MKIFDVNALKQLDPQTYSAIGGAITGGYLLDSPEDIYGTTLGIGIGALVGANLDIKLPKKVIHTVRNKEIALPAERPKTKKQTLREQIEKIISENMDEEGKVEFGFLPDNGIQYDKTDPYSTLTNENFRKAVQGASTEKELNEILLALQDQGYGKYDIKSVMTEWNNRGQVITMYSDVDIGTRLKKLEEFFKENGFSDKEVEEKMKIYKPLVNSESTIQIRKGTGELKIGGETFQVSNSRGIYSEGKNLYATQRVNPFAGAAINGMDGIAVAEALGIQYANEADRDAVAAFVEKSMKEGARPDELKAVLSRVPGIDKQKLDNYVQGAQQHRQYETGLMRAFDKLHAEGNMTAETRRILNQMSVEKTLYFDSEGNFDSDKFLRNLRATNTGDSKGSELQQYSRWLTEETGVVNPKEGVSADHVHTFSINRILDGGMNALVPAERKAGVTGARSTPIHLRKDATDATARAFQEIKNLGLIGDELDTSLGISRQTVDREVFNKLLLKVAPDKANLALGDGASVGRKFIRNQFEHRGFQALSINTDTLSKITLGDKITRILDTAKELGIGLDAPQITSSNYRGLLNRRERIIEKQNKKALEAGASNKKGKKSKKVKLADVAPETLKVDVAIANRKENLVKELTGLIEANQNEKSTAIFSSILEHINAGRDDEATELLNKYNTVTRSRFSKGEVIGINPNGEAVRVSSEFGNIRLKSYSGMYNGPGNPTSAEFIFELWNLVGSEKYGKDFGISAKEALFNANEEDFRIAANLAYIVNSPDYDLSDIDSGIIRYGKSKTAIPIEKLREHLDNMEVSADLAVITDSKGGGQGTSSKIFEELSSTGKLLAVDLHKDLRTSLQGLADAVPNILADHFSDLTPEEKYQIKKGAYWAVGQLSNSLTEGKSSIESVTGMMVLGKRNLEELITSAIDEGSYNSKIAEATLKSVFGEDLVENLIETKDRSQLQAEFTRRASETSKMFRLGNIAAATTSGAITSIDTFNMYRLAYLNPYETLHVASPEVSSIFRSNSGSLGKNMSHNAQKELIASGFSLEQMQLFGTQNYGKLYDAKFIEHLNKDDRIAYKDTLNAHLDTLDDGARKRLVSAIGRAAPDEIDHILKEFNVPENIREKDFLFYSLQDTNEQNIKTLPIYKQNTDSIARYTDATGRVSTKNPERTIKNILITQENAIANKVNNSAELDSYRQNTKTLKTIIENRIFSSENPELKNLLSMEAPNSSYSFVKVAGGEGFNDLAVKYQDKGSNLIGVSRKKARQILENMDIKVGKIDDFISEDGLLQIKLTDGSMVPHVGIEVREPALSGFSARAVYMYVFPEEQIDAKDTVSVFHSMDDIAYAKLMYGDEDWDHVLLYNFKEKLSTKEYEEFIETSSRANAHRNEMIALSSALGIKGSKKEEFSIFEVIEHVRSNIDSYLTPEEQKDEANFHRVVTEQLELRQRVGAEKGGYRKSLSPMVTKFASDLSDSFSALQYFNGEAVTLKDLSVMKILAHSMVENLIKTQHADTSLFLSGRQLPVEELVGLASKVKKDKGPIPTEQFKQKFSGFMEQLFTNSGKPEGQELLKKYRPYFDHMARAYITRTMDETKLQSNPMHVPSNAKGVMEDSSVNRLVGVMENVTGHSPQLPMVSKDTNIERTFKSSYNELLDIARENLSSNRMPLMIGAAALGASALALQRDPNFKGNKKSKVDLPDAINVGADPGSSFLASNMMSQESSYQSDPMHSVKAAGRQISNYITPEISPDDIRKTISASVTAYGAYTETEELAQAGFKKAIFGDAISPRIQSDF